MIRIRSFAAAALTSAVLAATASAQVGRNQGVLDANTASEAQLAAVPGLGAPLVRAILQARPFASVTGLDSLLAGQGVAPADRMTLYRHVFVHVNLVTGTRAEILLIPGAGPRMAREFFEYRPWEGGLVRVRREIGKYVDSTEVARLEQYVFYPLDLNTASDEDILTIPGVGRRMLREFREYRPYDGIEKFRREIGKYVDAREVARLVRYVTIR